MAARVHLVAGPAGSGKTAKLLQLYRPSLGKLAIASCLWLAPTHRAANEVRRNLLTSAARSFLAPGVATFEEFAFRIVESAPQPARPIDGLSKRRLLRRLVDQALERGELPYFAAIADSRGFVDLLAEWIAELKRIEIWPDDFAQVCRTRGSLAAKDRELLTLYRQYQEELNRCQLYDSEGRLWSAREHLRAGELGAYARVRLAVVDGFTDFTRTQHEMLEFLAERIEDLYISLPLEPESDRDELFAKSRATLEELQRRHPRSRVEHLPREERASWPAQAHIESQLFKDPRHIAAARDNRGLEILAAAGRLNELELVGRRIKQLLVDGDPAHGGAPVAAEAIAVVFRSVADWAPLVREVFDEQGIPYVLEGEPALTDRPPIIALLNLLRVDQEDWPYRRLLAAVGNNYFAPRWQGWHAETSTAAIERVVRRLQIPSGRRKLLEAIEWALARADQRAPLDEEGQRENEAMVAVRQRDLTQARSTLTRLAAVYDRLPARADLATWSAVLTELAQQTGLLHAASADDRIAWDELLAALERLAQLERHLGEEAETLSRHEFYQLLADVARWHRPQGRRDESGCVRVVSAPAARALSIPYLFLAGLTERSFPAALREDRFYTEHEYQAFREAGLPLELRADQNQKEMLLFYELVTRARRRLTLSYPALDERGEPLLASPFLTELERAFGPLGVTRHAETGLSPVPRDHDPLSLREARLRAADLSLSGQPEALAAFAHAARTQTAGANIVAGLRLTRERSRREEFGIYEGIVVGEATLAQLARDFGNEHLWSPSQLELYAQCPFRFFAEQVLGAAPLDELGLQIDHARRGWLLHETLKLLHRQQIEGDTARTALDEHFVATLAELLQSSAHAETLSAALDEIDRRVIGGWAGLYAEQHQGYSQSWSDFDAAPTPRHFEVSFGLPAPSDDAISTVEPLIITEGDITVLIGGRIDRLDVGEHRGRVVFNVIDYKTGYVPSAKKLREFHATSLQLDIYTHAAEDLLLAGSEALPWNAGYWQIRKRGFHQPLALAVDDEKRLARAPEWELRRQKLRETVLRLVRSIRAGRFPMSNEDEDCTSRCTFRTVCRVHQTRALDKLP
ncbi:MAG: PD-(D/E)XK nuclease family protein [Pirellulales bacterium]|nr:PD-(D/E)XK nuclease family protein [Pirellulales bacterium]